MVKNEAKFITKELMPWLRSHLHINMLAEAKFITIKEKRYNYKSDKSLKKEITNLKIAGRIFAYKFPDGTIQGTPCDICKIVEGQGYFFFKFEAVKKKFFAINVGRIEAEINDGTKSLSAERAEEISDYVILAKKLG